MSHRIHNFCQDCGSRLLKRGKIRPKRCGICYKEELKKRSGENSPNYKPEIQCCKNCGGPKTPLAKKKICKKCYDESMSALNRCKKCGGKRARKTSEYCKNCYRGEITKRWNPELTETFRKEGRTVNPEYYVWRLRVFERDRFICQKCGDDKGGNLVAHHIFSFKENELLRTEINNGITLCSGCHRLFHKRYSYRNNNIQQLKEFLNIDHV